MAKQLNRKEQRRSLTPYHEYLGTLLQFLEIPSVKISTEVDVVKKMPKADILLLLREGEVWTDDQRRYLPDGVRDGNARHKLLEFKYTESFNEDALEQTIGYDIFYRRTYGLSREDVDSYVLVSMTPDSKTLSKFGYKATEHPGIYRSEWVLVSRVMLVVLNDLSDAAHNVYVKLFASKKLVKQKAVEQLKEIGALSAFTQLGNYLFGLVELLFKGEEMELTRDEVLMPDELVEIGRELFQSYFAGLLPEQRMADLLPEQRMAGLPPEQRMAGLPLEQRLAGLPSQDILTYLDLDEIEEFLKNHKQKYSG